MRKTQLTTAGFVDRGRASRNATALEAKSDPQLTASRKTGTPALQLQGTKFCQNSHGQKTESPLELPETDVLQTP